VSVHRARIEPVPDGVARPRWSVMVPTYDSAGYLREALESVVTQAPGRDGMQIEVVDDCSHDDPGAVVAELDGRVDLHRQPRNVGHVANFNTCLARARGELVHLLHGDDAVLPGFYEALGRPFADRPDVGAAFCRYVAVDEEGRRLTVSKPIADRDGVLEGWLERIAEGQLVQPPSVVVRRSVYERLGGFDDRIARYGEDWEMWTRIAAHFPVWHVVEPLAVYRVQATSLSGESLRTGENVRDLRRVIAINREVLPAERADELTRRALEVTATTALKRGRRLLAAGHWAGGLAQAWEALRSSRSPRVLPALLRFAAAVVRRGALRAARR
jgi:glycosyltransferase involved in cell wall biosynthesis